MANLSERIEVFLRSAFEPLETMEYDEAYQVNFSSDGERKSKYILERLSKLEVEARIDPRKMAYVSIGGADGSELEAIMENTRISTGILVEVSDAALAAAKRRLAKFSETEGQVILLKQDAVLSVPEVYRRIKDLGLTEVCVSTQAVLHELPDRSSPHKSHNRFLGSIFGHFERTLFVAREPCDPDNWPEELELTIPSVSATRLAEFIKFIGKELSMDFRSVDIIANRSVIGPRKLLVESLHKLLRCHKPIELRYELVEQLTSFDANEVRVLLDDYCGSKNNVELEFTSTDGFRDAYREHAISACDTSKRALPMPNTHARFIAFQETLHTTHYSREGRFAKEGSKHSRGNKDWLQTHPPKPDFLIGREQSTHDIAGLLKEHRGPVVLTGWPGVGKTASARVLLDDCGIMTAFPDGQYWFEVRPGDSPFEALRMIAATLRIDAETDSTPDLRNLMHALREFLKTRRLLLVIDDVWTVEQAEAFRNVLTQVETSGALFTTRFPRVAQSVVLRPTFGIYPIEELGPEDGSRLIATLAPKVAEVFTDELIELSKQLEGLPLALQIVGRLLAKEHGLGLPVHSLLAELSDAHRLLGERAPEDRFDPEFGTTPTVRLLFAKSTDRLDEQSRERFALFGVWSNPAVFDTEILSELWETSDPLPTLRTLADLGLVEPMGNGWFRVHALLIAHANQLLE